MYANFQTYGVNQLNIPCKNKMRTIFTEFLKSELRNKADISSVRNSKLCTYKQFKNKFAVENYLIVIPNFDSKVASGCFSPKVIIPLVPCAVPAHAVVLLTS